MPAIILSRRQANTLKMIRSVRRPGHIASAREPSLRALERRGLVTGRADPTAAGRAIWNPTAAGRAWIDQERAEWEGR